MTTKLLRMTNQDNDGSTLLEIPKGMSFDDAMLLANAVIRTVNDESANLSSSSLFPAIMARLSEMGFCQSQVSVEDTLYWDTDEGPDEQDAQVLAAHAARTRIAAVLATAAEAKAGPRPAT